MRVYEKMTKPYILLAETTATFDTFERNKLLDMYHKKSENDGDGKIRKLLSRTNLLKKVPD